MSINLLEIIQQNLGYPALQKIDPNTQEVVVNDKTAAEDRFSQAAIPAVVVGLYRLVQSDEGAEFLLSATTGEALVNEIFKDNKAEAIGTIAEYANESTEYTHAKVSIIAAEAVNVVRQNLPEGAGIKEVKTFFVDQRNNILLYLPPALKMGVLLDDNTLDDNTHKMEGPISSFMQSMGNLFSKPVDKKEADKLGE